MLRRWICYAAAVLGAVAFRIFYTGWLAGVVLAAVCCLPLLALVLALPAVVSCRLTLSPQAGCLTREEEGQWRLTLAPALGLPLGRVRVRVKSANILWDTTEKCSRTGFCPGTGAVLPLPAPTGRCGLVEGRVARAWALDPMGLFWLPLRRGKEARMWVLPTPRTQDLPPLPQEERPTLRPRPGGGPGEDYDPREYRPGDPMNAIHWKLSAKRDALITRETLETVKPLPMLTLDCFGPPAQVEATLELLRGMSDALLAQDRPHVVVWVDQPTLQPRRMEISDAAGQLRCLEVLLSQRAPLTGRSVRDLPGVGVGAYLQGEVTSHE